MKKFWFALVSVVFSFSAHAAEWVQVPGSVHDAYGLPEPSLMVVYAHWVPEAKPGDVFLSVSRLNRSIALGSLGGSCVTYRFLGSVQDAFVFEVIDASVRLEKDAVIMPLFKDFEPYGLPVHDAAEAQAALLLCALEAKVKRSFQVYVPKSSGRLEAWSLGEGLRFVLSESDWGMQVRAVNVQK